MALGDGNNGKKQYNETTYFSRIRFSNREDRLSMTFSYWKGMLKVAIAEEEVSQSGNKYNEVAAIYLSPMKAKLLFGILSEKIVTGPNDDSYGINTGMGETQSLITFGWDNNTPYCVICKITGEGTIQDPVRFKFNVDYHYIIKYKNFEKMDCEKEYLDKTELEMFTTVLDEYVKSMTGAVGYGVMDMARFDISRINTKLELMMDSMGIERKSSYQPNGSSQNSYFNKNGAASSSNSNRGRSEHKTADDIDELLD